MDGDLTSLIDGCAAFFRPHELGPTVIWGDFRSLQFGEISAHAVYIYKSSAAYFNCYDHALSDESING
jgi:hypothetical protein